MDYNKLTLEAKSVLLTLYKAYNKKLINGLPRSQARTFYSFPDIHKTYFKDWNNEEDLLDVFKELGKNNWISSEWGNNTIAYTSLSTEAIAILQGRFQSGVKQVVNELAKIKSIIF